MTRRLDLGLLLVAVACAAPARAGQQLLLTGEVRALEAETIYVPPSNSSPVALRYLAPEGSQVAQGEVLVRIDPGDALTRIETLTSQIEQATARADKEIAERAVREVEAELALVDAEATLAIARIDAAIPRQFLPAIDYDRHQTELERATREHALKLREHQDARRAVARRREDKHIEIRRLEADRRFARAQVVAAEQRATRAGVVLYGFNPWSGQRYQEGASANPGSAIGMVVGDGEMAVRAWALEPDRASLAAGQAVRVRFDALSGIEAGGRIESISGAPEPKAEWGDGRYFTVEISLAPNHGLALLPGMSVQIEPLQRGDDP